MNASKKLLSDIDNRESVKCDFSSNSSSLLIIFGGMKGNLIVPPFEFSRSAENLDAKKLFLRDLQQCWYHKGLSNITDNIDSTVGFIKEIIDSKRIEKVVLIGGSMGGYGAILWGHLLNADIVHAFSPQTFIDAKNREFFDDDRWTDEIRAVHNAVERTEKYFDLLPLLKSNPTKCQFNIYFDIDHRLDKDHAMRLGNIGNVELKPVDGGGHSSAKQLRNSGMLMQILVESCLPNHSKTITIEESLLQAQTQNKEKVMASSTKVPAKIQKNMELGKKLKQEGSLPQAIEKFQMAVRLNPNNVQALSQLTAAYATQNNWQEVVNCCYRIIGLRPNNTRSYLQLAKALKKQNKIYAAVGALKQAKELDADALKAPEYRLLGDLLAQLGASENQESLTDETIAAYQKLTELKPNLPTSVYVKLGDMLQKQSKFEEAISSYQKAVELKPDGRPAVYLKLGTAQIKQGKLDEAIATYRKVIELDANSLAGHRGLGNAFEKKGLLDDAIKCYNRAIQIKPDGAGLYRSMGDVLTKQGRSNEASQYYQKADSISA